MSGWEEKLFVRIIEGGRSGKAKTSQDFKWEFRSIIIY